MHIQNNILRHYLQNCYFINGTAYAGKSTMCKMLAERFDMIQCEENYNMDTILQVVTQEEQPDFSYFNTKPSWQHYVSRSPEEFERWSRSVSEEVTGFEIAELIRLSAHGKKIIVDTNISCETLRQIAQPDHVALLLSPQSMSVERFFDREDEEKQFLLSVVESTPDPEWTRRNFEACIARINRREVYDAFLNSGFYTIVRKEADGDTREETLAKLAKHFGLME